MNLKGVIRSLFATTIIGVELDYKTCNVLVHSYKRGALVHTQAKKFRTNPGELPIQAVRFIQKIQTKNPFTYISTLTASIVQGALNTTKEQEFETFGVNAKEVAYKRFDNDWSVYVSSEGVAEVRQKFLRIGVDFTISPFLVLYHLAKETFQDSCKLYVLFQRSNLTMLVTKQNCGVLFGGYYVLESAIDSELAIVKNTLSEDERDIETTNIEEDLQQELSGIEEVDLSNSGNDDELIEVLKGGEGKEESFKEDGEAKDDLDDYSRVSTAANFIQGALNEFYSNEIYAGEFINEIVVFNPHEISYDTLSQIQKITMLETQILNCDIAQVLADLGYESYRFFEAKGQV